MTAIFTDNAAEHRFEYNVEGQIAFADYRRDNKTLYIDYVEAPTALRGTGAAGKLMEHIMTMAKKEALDVVAICGYAASWISRHAENR